MNERLVVASSCAGCMVHFLTSGSRSRQLDDLSFGFVFTGPEGQLLREAIKAPGKLLNSVAVLPKRPHQIKMPLYSIGSLPPGLSASTEQH